MVAFPLHPKQPMQYAVFLDCVDLRFRCCHAQIGEFVVHGHCMLLRVLQIGENPALANELEAGVPCHEDYLLPKLKDLLTQHYGATPIASN